MTDSRLSIISPGRRDLGLHRLMSSPLDVVRCGAHAWTTGEGRGSELHQELFHAYVAELKEVVPEARRIWLEIIDDCERRTRDRASAMAEAVGFAPAGAAFDARVVHVVRKYWLACDALNRRTKAQEQKVSPQAFMLQWLVDIRYQDAVEVLAGMPYWPLGLDETGNWV